tara:strand:- start:21404 stop:24922 length:3519 start_codon:yes stop_codon:yes gene_type:complete
MATYVPNVNPYLPNVKAFTPDYKFLSDALQQRQTKYDSNYKQLNNAYSKVVYAGLSREDTNKARDQFINNLQPELEKISGLDLSLAQNVRAAQGVFQPFYDNDLVVKDMVMTKDYQNKIALAQDLKTSTNEEENDRYWDEGVKLLKYKMDDFINASQEDALSSSMPSYMQNPQLYKKAKSYLEKKGYTVKYDTLSPGGDFIVTDTNGKNITATAMADLKMNFQNNDIIQNGYYTKSYVDSRQYAENQMKDGAVNSISEGILKYNKGNIEVYKEMNIANSVKYDEQVKTINKELDVIETELKRQGRTPKPDSEISKQIELMKNRVEGLTAEKEMSLKTAELADRILTSNDPNEINNKGYNVQMQSNIIKDLNAAATNYSMLTAERTIKVNQAELQRRKEVHEVKMSSIRFQQDKLLKEIETTEQEKRLKTKIRLNLEAGLNADGTKKAVGTTGNAILDRSGGSFSLNNTEDIVSTENYLGKQELYIEDKEISLSTAQIENYIQAYDQLNKSAPKNMVELPSKFELTSEDKDKIRYSAPNNKSYVSKDLFREIAFRKENYEKFEELQKSIYEVTSIDESKETIFEVNNVLGKLKENYTSNKEQESLTKSQLNNLYKTTKDNLELKYNLLDKKGIPSIFSEDEDGNVTKLTREQYSELISKQIKEGKITGKAFEELAKNDGKKPLKKVMVNRGAIPSITSEKIDGQEKQGYELSSRNYVLSPSRSKLVRTDAGNYLFTSESFLPKGTEKTTQLLKQDIEKDGRYKLGQDNKYVEVNQQNQPVIDPRYGRVQNFRLQRVKKYSLGEVVEILNREKQNSFNQQNKGELEQKMGVGWRSFNPTNRATYTTIGVGINDNYSAKSDTAYDGILKTIEDINNSETSEKGYTFVNYKAQDDGKGSAITSMPNMYIGMSKTLPLGNTDKDNPKSESVPQGVFALQALNAPGAIVSHQVETISPKDEGIEKAPIQLSNPNAKLQMFNILENWSQGKLDKKYNYNIKYKPALPGQDNSTYELIRTQNISGTTTSIGKPRTQTYTLSIPSQYDKNNLNPKNNKSVDLLSSLIDDVSKSYERKLPNNSKINAYLSNEQWTIEQTFFQYDLISDSMVEVDISSTKYGDVAMYRNKSSEQATEKYYEYLNYMSEWSSIQFNKQKDAQKIFKKALEKDSNVTWEEVFKIK